MKILCVSDLHGVEWYVDVLIDYLVSNQVEFDCILLGGDIVGRQSVSLADILSRRIKRAKTASTENKDFVRIMSKLASLGKDVFYCLGNWDASIPYDISDLGNNCHHIHGKVISFKGYYFTGFSGCSMDWGQNPILLRTDDYLFEKYKEFIESYNFELEASEKERNLKIDLLGHVAKRYDRYRELASLKYRDKRKKPYKEAFEKLRLREKSLNKRAYSYESKKFKEICNSDECQKYVEERYNLKNSILSQNIESVISMLKKDSVPLDRLIFLSHERIDRFAEYFDDTPFCHMFGHRHGHMSSYRAIRGMPNSGRTNYINISALDINRPKKSIYDLPPNFVIAEFNGSSRVKSNPIYLDVFRSRIPMNTLDKKSIFGIQEQLEDYYHYQKGLSSSEYSQLVSEFSEFVGWP